MNQTLEQFRNRLVQKRSSKNTISIYCNYFEDFCNYFKHNKLQDIIPVQINTYILNLIETKNISISQQNQRINAIKFYYEKYLEKKNSTTIYIDQRKNKNYPKF